MGAKWSAKLTAQASQASKENKPQTKTKKEITTQTKKKYHENQNPRCKEQMSKVERKSTSIRSQQVVSANIIRYEQIRVAKRKFANPEETCAVRRECGRRAKVPKLNSKR